MTEDLSLDDTPTLRPTVMAMLKTDEEDIEEVIKNEEQEEDTEPLTHLVAEMPESDIPAYIGGLKCSIVALNFDSAEAAELISSALSFEAEERLEESVAAYRCSMFAPKWVKFATKAFAGRRLESC